MAAQTAAEKWTEYLSSFGLPAYDENTVPEDASLPRITYSWAESELDAPVAISASLWYRSKKWKEITQKASEIYDAVGTGVVLPIAGGYLWINRGVPFSQRVADADDGIRRILLNFSVEFLRA